MPKKIDIELTNSQEFPNQSINEILLNLNLTDLKKLLKKHTRNSEISEKILHSSKNICSFSDINRDCTSLFYYCEAQRKLIVNNLHEDNEDSILITKDFFLKLSKYSTTNFKIYYLDRDLWDLVFCVYNKGELSYSCQNVSDWEDPLYFDDVPYFIALAKEKGMKKKKNEDGDKVWDSEEVYNLIYEFRDLLASSDNTYLKIAPDWFLKMQSIAQ